MPGLLDNAGDGILEGWRRAALRPVLPRIAASLAVAAVVGGWFYARNLVQYGYVQPHGLPHHQLMFQMPPGERTLADYVRIPLATFSDPQSLNPDLQHSVWGTTYAGVWFDTQRHFLARSDAIVSRIGTATIVLGLLPTLAFGAGLARGLRRTLRAPSGPDAALVLFSALTLAGYAYYTWRNPWFAVLKGTSLLGLCLPYSYYASESLERWLRRGGPAAFVVSSGLAAGVVCVTLACTFDLVVPKHEIAGLDWRAAVQP